MRRVLVTGGGGFVGQALVRALVERGAEVAVIGRNPYPQLEAIGVRCHLGDIRDPGAVERAAAGQDMVFHVAAKAGVWGSRRDYFGINRDGTANVLAACRQRGVARLVYTSTPSVVFDRRSLAGVDETTSYAARPLCYYAASKIAAERLVLEANGPDVSTVAIRPHLVWGPGDPHLVPRLLTRGRAGQLAIVGLGTNRVDITHIDNVVHAHLLAAENLATVADAAGQAFFIGQERPVELWPWINDLFARLDIPQVKRMVPFRVAYGVGFLLETIHALLRWEREPRMTRFIACQLAHSHWFSHRKAERILGYRPLVSTAEGVTQLVCSLRAQAGWQRR